jgi:NADPH-dependent 2,4-dienoyl-CoA reductase/sulfur reductase-like enzyme
MASCGYPYFVGGLFDDPNQLIATPAGVHRDPGYFSKVKGINARVETEALSINREEKTVLVKNLKTDRDETISYDKLILATGANPIKPPIPGIDLDGVDTLQSMGGAPVVIKMIAAKSTGRFLGMQAVGMGEVLIPLGQLQENLDKLPEDKNVEIITYCKISLRGYEAACSLNARGYSNVKVLEGGILAWPFPRGI